MGGGESESECSEEDHLPSESSSGKEGDGREQKRKLAFVFCFLFFFFFGEFLREGVSMALPAKKKKIGFFRFGQKKKTVRACNLALKHIQHDEDLVAFGVPIEKKKKREREKTKSLVFLVFFEATLELKWAGPVNRFG